MPVEIKITADTMDELWAMLSTFNVPRVHAGHLSEEDLKRQRHAPRSECTWSVIV